MKRPGMEISAVYLVNEFKLKEFINKLRYLIKPKKKKKHNENFRAQRIVLETHEKAGRNFAASFLLQSKSAPLLSKWSPFGSIKPR